MSYSDHLGGSNYNQLLGQQRAEKVAGIIQPKLAKQARIQSVYFGQTTQFNPSIPAANRMVELWKLMP